MLRISAAISRVLPGIETAIIAGNVRVIGRRIATALIREEAAEDRDEADCRGLLD